MKSVKHQHGFAAVEAILVIIVLGIVGFTGWFVYHSKQATDKTLSRTGKSTLPIEKRITKSSTDSQKYLVIKEWGVEIPVSSMLADITYKITTYSDGGQSVGFTLASLRGTECNLDDSIGGMIRFMSGYIDSITNKKMTELYPLAKMVGSYYYAPALPQSACTTNEIVAAKVDATRQPLIKAVGLVRKP